VDRHDLSSLRIVASSGSALPGLVATEWMDRAGENLYNLYGSTEVGQATIATPADLRARPGTAGRVVPGTTVAILDEHDHRLPDGAEGRIYVDSGAQFSGYTGGGTKERVGTLMATGDVGHFDADGLLFVTGRSDDMIVSGGENVFPREVEDLLLAHPAVLDAAVVGVDDAEFGQRLAAHVVTAPGSGLTARAVRSLVGGSLARHKVPRDVVFVDELPRTTTGKLRRKDLGAAR
jgi:fatty-acyl-CoA synthase